MNLKSKLVLGNMFVVVLTLGCLTYMQLQITSHFSDEILFKTSKNISERFVSHEKNHVSEMVSYLTEALLNPMYFRDINTIHTLIEPVLKSQSVLSVTVFDSNGLIVETGERSISNYGTPLDMPLVLKSVLSNREVYTNLTQSEFITAHPLIINGRLLGGLVMSYSLSSVQKDIDNNTMLVKQVNDKSRKTISVLSASVAIAMSLISIYLSMLIAGMLINPIAKLLKHAKRISEGKYLVPNNVQCRDEIGKLALAFEEMDICLKKRKDAIEFLAYNDHLTKLPNRTQFISALEQQIETTRESGDKLAILFIDLDEFKNVNDNLGHSAGDELLRKVARMLRCIINAHDGPNNLVARIGGDEFLLCLSQIQHSETANLFASHIVDILSEPIELETAKESVVIGASVGIALYPDSGSTPEDIVKNADIAMYKAKGSGKNGYRCFTYEMERKILDRGYIERELRFAIKDFSQFKIFYQPKVKLKTGEIIGAEALLRWDNPSKGSISPTEFIPIAEAKNMIHPLGNWVVEQVCKDIQSWNSSVLSDDFHVALNLSAKQLYGGKVSSVIQQRLKEYRLKASCLHVEVTETALMNDKVSAKKTLDSLRKLGVEVWLDDFGTGYSSLGYLREFNVDGLKIDRSFVSDIEHDSNDRSLCSAIISMAHQLGIQVVAEGIETTIQSSFLSRSKCDYGQGYLYAKPMPSEDLESLLQTLICPDVLDTKFQSF